MDHSFEKHSTGASTLPADLRSACYRAALAEADEAAFQRFLRLYRAADLHEEKDRISRALGAVRDPALLKRVLDFAISVSPRRPIPRMFDVCSDRRSFIRGGTER